MAFHFPHSASKACIEAQARQMSALFLRKLITTYWKDLSAGERKDVKAVREACGGSAFHGAEFSCLGFADAARPIRGRA